MASDRPAPPARIHLSKAEVSSIETELVHEALQSGWIAPLGPHVDRFEGAMAARIGVAGAVALSSGTAALQLALLQAGAAPGRVVLVPSLTFAATANAVCYTAAEPVFVDSRGADGNVDGELLLAAVAELRDAGTDIAAVVSVDLFGRAADYTSLQPALEQWGIPLVEDAAEALGATHDGRPAGSFGQSAAFSFNGNKIVTTSGGGMLLSNDLDLLSRVRYLASQARQPQPWYEHTEVGFNYRMSNVLAALGLGQLSRLDEMIARRRAIRERYFAAFQDLDGVSFLGRRWDGDDAEDNCWLTCVVIDPERHPVGPDQIVARLDAQGIEARHLWKPMHLQPLYRHARMFDTGVSARLFARGLALPSGSGLADADINRVIAAFRAALVGRS